MRPIGFIRLIGIMGLVWLLLTPSPTLAYERETHKQLAAEAVKLFNRYYPESTLNNSATARLVAGANDEDDSIRPFHHFYDPVKNRGLTIGPKEWSSAKQWAVDQAAQQAAKPPSFLARVFAGDAETDFTWQKALNDYRDGNEEKAFSALGHIIHLIQDLTVPAHTRNDQHLFGDAYEKFSAEQNINDLTAESIGRPTIQNKLDDYFDESAGYTNKNFYSPHTIGLTEYQSPEPDYPIFRDGYYYYAETDELGQYFLSRKSGQSLLFANSFDITVDDPLVLNGYWERLAPRALRYSAGVIYLFLKEAGAIPKNKEINKINGSDDTNRSDKRMAELETKFGILLGQIGQLVSDNQLTLKEFKKLIEKNQLQPKTAEKKPLAVGGAGGGLLGALAGNSSNNTSGDGGGDGGGANAANNNAGAANIVISEFLFDAEGPDGGKEYVRLCNLGDAPVDISQWSIQVGDLSSLKKKNFEEGNIVAPRAPFLIWFGENPAANMLWKSGSLKNATSSIFLVNGNALIAAENDAAIADRADYDVSLMPGFEPGQAVVINACGGALSNNQYQRPSDNNGTGGDNSASAVSDQAIAFYKNPDGGDLIDIDIDRYQPLTLNANSQFWQILVFYKNSDGAANPPQFIQTSDNWTPGQENVLTVSYPNYAGNPVRKSLIVPAAASGSGSDGGIMNSAYDFKRLTEDRMARLQTLESADYLTTAVYNFYQSGGGEQIFKLATIDSTKYYWRDRPPAYQAPIFVGNNNLELKFNEETSRLEINWPKATDEDSLDNLIIFELTINSSVSETTFNNTSHSLIANPGDRFAISLKAKDEFNNYSETLSADWSYPMSELLLSQLETAGWSQPIGQKNPNCPACPASVSQQEIIADRHLDFNLVSVRLDTGTGEWPAKIMLGLHEDHQLRAVKIIPGITKLNPDQDLTFIFDGLITMERDKIYQLTLSISEFASNGGYFYSNIRNAVNENGDWYIKLGKK